MTALDPRQSPDPLRPDDTDLLWDPVARAFVPRRSHPPGTRFAVALLVAFAFALGFVAGTRAAPRADSLPSIPVADAGQLGAPQNVGAGGSGDVTRPVQEPAPQGQVTSPATESGAPTPPPAAAAVQSTPSPVTEPPAVMSGTASWYNANGLIAAVPDWHFGDRPYRVRVTGNGHSVVVLVQDFCGCPGGRLIDLSDDAFRRLAPLSVGVLHVQVEDVAGPGITVTPPPTDVMP